MADISSNPAADEKKETDVEAAASSTTSAAAAKQTLKDLIHITEGTVDADDAEMMSSDPDGTDGGDWETLSEKHPVQKAVDDLTSSVRGGFETHVAPKVDELVSNTQFLLDTHVAPHFKGVQEHSSRAVAGIQEHSGKALSGLQQNTSKVVQGVQQHSDRVLKDVQEHSTRAVASLQEHSTKAVKDVQENTAKAVKGVQETTVKAWQATEQSTKEFHSQHVAPHVEKATVATKEFHDVHVKPTVDRALAESTRALETTGSCLQQTYAKCQHTVIVNRPFYWNTAPDLFDESIQPWYLVLEEGTCRSFGQVVFCNNPVTGIFVWMAILVASPVAALCSACCVIMVSVETENVCHTIHVGADDNEMSHSLRLIRFVRLITILIHVSVHYADQLDGIVFGYGSSQASPRSVCCQQCLGRYQFGGLLYL